METEYSKEELRKRYKNLPDELKEAIDSVETDEIIWAIGQKHLLHVDQIGLLSKGLGYVILGLIHPRDFRNFLKEKLAISDDEANLIIYDLNKEILDKIRDSILNQYEPTIRVATSATAASQLQADATEQKFNTKMDTILNLPKEEVEVVSKNNDNSKSGFETKVRDPYHEPL